MCRRVMMLRLPRRMEMVGMVGMVPPEQGRPGLCMEAGGDSRDQHLESDYCRYTGQAIIKSHAV